MLAKTDTKNYRQAGEKGNAQGERGWRLKPITTRYAYDILNELVAVTDAQGNTTTVTYDDYGRRVAIDNPDTGKTQWWYDDAGNMIAKQTANLHKKNQYIRYSYCYHQLKMIDNSKNYVMNQNNSLFNIIKEASDDQINHKTNKKEIFD